MSLTLITPPALEPVSLYEMKLQCGFGPMEDTDQLREQTLSDDLRDALTAARQNVEEMIGRALITQTWELTLQRFPRWNDEYLIHDKLDIDIPLPKFGEITAFTYIDYAGVEQNMLAQGAWGYQVIAGGDTRPARLIPPYGLGWPVTLSMTADAVVIQYTCGYGPNPTDVPASIRNAIKVNAKWFYEGCKGEQPTAVARLLFSSMNLIA